jgi:hypothetical protein
MPMTGGSTAFLNGGGILPPSMAMNKSNGNMAFTAPNIEIEIPNATAMSKSGGIALSSGQGQAQIGTRFPGSAPITKVPPGKAPISKVPAKAPISKVPGKAPISKTPPAAGKAPIAKIPPGKAPITKMPANASKEGLMKASAKRPSNGGVPAAKKAKSAGKGW